jgi:hypothetical protein
VYTKEIFAPLVLSTKAKKLTMAKSKKRTPRISKPKIKRDYPIMSDGDLKNIAVAIFSKMTGNPSFPNPDPALADLDNATQQFASAQVLAINRDIQHAEEKNMLREVLIEVLDKLSLYVTFIAKGDRSILLSSGYNITSGSKKEHVTPVVKSLTVTYGDVKGQVVLTLDFEGKNKGFGAYYAVSPVLNKAWMHEPGGSKVIVISDLTPGTTYDFMMFMTISDTVTLYSDVVTKIVV